MYKDTIMDAQGCLDELLAELSRKTPNRDYVIRDVKELLEALEDGYSLPVVDLEN
jgi:hypothetical protein